MLKSPSPSRASLARYSLYKLNRVGDKQHPCLTPLFLINRSTACPHGTRALPSTPHYWTLLLLKTQAGWGLMFFVTDTSLAVTIWISYCFVVQFQCLHNYGLIFLHLYVGNSITSHILLCRFHFFLSLRHVTCVRICSFHSLSLVSSAERQLPFQRGGRDVATLCERV